MTPKAPTKHSDWSDFIINEDTLDYSDRELSNIRRIGSNSVAPNTMFFELSRNPGIGLMFLDASEDNLQVLHHPTVIGGSWQQKEQKLIALSGITATPTAVQIIPKSIKQIQTKVPLVADLIQPNKDLSLVKCHKSRVTQFTFKNLIPIPISLLRIFITLPSTDPASVAKAFILKIQEMNSTTIQNDTELTETPKKTPDDTIDNTETTEDEIETPVTSLKTADTISEDNVDNTPIALCSHIIQFLYLCLKGKMPSIHYTIPTDTAITTWHAKLTMEHLKAPPTNFITTSNSLLEHQSSDDDTSNTNSSQMSLKNQHVILALQKISENLDQNAIRAREDSDRKEPGFKKLEPHRKNLILNASAPEPFDTAPDKPTAFYDDFLSRKTQFKARDILITRLNQDKIYFRPSSAFAAYLYSADWIWEKPETPTGISVFYCPESSSISTSYNDYEKALVMLNKIERQDIKRLMSQSLVIPDSIMSAIFMLENLKAITTLCFGEESHSTICIQSWVDHMMRHRQMYKSCHESDNSFLTQVLFAIDTALQIHWRSCADAEDRTSVNDKILIMDDLQMNIERHNFSYLLPKNLLDKLQPEQKPEDDGAKYPKNKKFKGDKDKDNNNFKKNRITDNHTQWHLKETENFAEIFYANKSKCPRTKDGILICMKFFIRGFCDRNCTRAHQLSESEEKEFDIFISHCRKKDFPQGAGGTP
jgi:hypothetical protein